jgi:hypothetical protein
MWLGRHFACKRSRTDGVWAQQQRQNLLAFGFEIVDRSLARPHQISHRLVPRIRNPDCSQFTRAQQLRQVERVAPAGLHPVTRLLRDQRLSDLMIP